MIDHDARRQLRADLLEELNSPKHNPLPSDFQSLEDADRAIERALNEWRQNILEPVGAVSEHPILDRYIHQGSGWTWIEKYENRKLAWCGHFLAYAYRESLNAAVRKSSCPSTYRLREWAKGSRRIIDGLHEARRGDIVVVGHKKAWGDHITLIEKIETDHSGYWSIEGNAFGETPESTSRKEGVIRRFRNRELIKAIYRPLECDR